MKLYLICSLTLTALALSGCRSNPSPTTMPETSVTPNVVQAAEPKPHVPSVTITNEISLFDGATLQGWHINDFGGNGGAEVVNGNLRIHMGADLTGITWTNASILPTENYEIELEAMKLSGTDFFCGLTFPVRTNHCSLICGGWGGSVVGISSLDGMDASENDTSKNIYFEPNRWFKIRVQVTPKTIKTWIDDKNLIDVNIDGRRVAMRPGDIEQCVPLGLSTWQTGAQFRNIKLKPVQP